MAYEVATGDAVARGEQAQRYLLGSEAANNLLLWLIEAARAGVGYSYLGAITRDGRIQALALQNQVQLMLSTADDLEAVEQLAADMHAGGLTVGRLNGPRAVGERFVRTWESLAEARSRLGMRYRIYEARSVVGTELAPGRLRVASEADRGQLEDWVLAFALEAESSNPTREHATAVVTEGLHDGGMHVWEVDGKVVSMANVTGATPNGIRVNRVFTPPEMRRRGYASASVATLTQKMLDGGRALCFLYTDPRNPTSNHIYQEIGYRPVIDVDEYWID